MNLRPIWRHTLGIKGETDNWIHSKDKKMPKTTKNYNYRKILEVALILCVCNFVNAGDQKMLKQLLDNHAKASYVVRQVLIGWDTILGNSYLVREEVIVQKPPSESRRRLILYPLMSRGDPINRYEQSLTAEQQTSIRHKVIEMLESGVSSWEIESYVNSSLEKYGIDRSTERRRFVRDNLPRPKRISRLLKENIDILGRNYEIQKGDSADKIAGYETVLFSIEPNFEDRPTLRVWLEKENGIPLRFERINKYGQMQYLLVSTQISFDLNEVDRTLGKLAKDETSNVLKGKARQTLSLPEAEKAFGQKLILPNYLPAGFELHQIEPIKFPQTTTTTLHFRYTDGFLTFSLFEATGQKSGIFSRFRPRRSKRSRRNNNGRGNDRGSNRKEGKIEIGEKSIRVMRLRHAQVYSWIENDVNLRLIGDLSRSEMIRIIESISSN